MTQETSSGPHLQRASIAELMAGLAERPSEFGPLGEAEPAIHVFIAEEVAPRLSACGMTVEPLDQMGNLIARAGERRGRRLLLVMNAMTQPAYDMPNPFTPRIVSGAPYGIDGEVMIARGMSEQKANMAAMLAGIAHALSQGPLAGELVALCCPSGETGRHDAIAHAMSEGDIKADMAVLGGTSLAISLGNRGRVDLALHMRGRTAHASRPQQGANAALAACRLIPRLIKMGNAGTPHPVLGAPSLTLTGLRSFPQTSHTVQDHCIADLDRRLVPGEDPHAVTADLHKMLDEAAPHLDPFSGEEITATLETGAYMYPSLVEESSPVVQAIIAAARTETGTAPDLIHLPNAFDQGYLNHLDIPTVNFGCGEYAHAHTHDDLASIERTHTAARIFARLIIDVCGE